MHINIYIYMCAFSKFAQVGAVHMQFQYLQQFQYAHLISTCFRFFQVAFVGGFQVVSSADGLGLAVKDAIVDAAKAGKIAEECRDAKGLAEGRQTRHDGSLEPLVYLVGCLDCPLNSS